MKLGVVQPASARDIAGEIATAVRDGIAGAEVTVESGSPGHFRLTVKAEAFRGESRVNAQRLVYRCIAHLMKGDGAPVHAVDALLTLVP